jgi:hypothetical protein
MKTHTSLGLVLFTVASFGWSALSAAPHPKPALVHPVKYVDYLGSTVIDRSTSMVTVLQALGLPHRKLSDAVWAYPHFNGGDAQPRGDDCSILLLTFADGYVSDIKLVNDRALIAYAADIRAASFGKTQVASNNKLRRGDVQP